MVMDYTDHQYRKNIHPGLKVAIVKKEHQKTGQVTYGTVIEILTSAAVHTQGIKVRLESGEVGRVQFIEE